MSNDALALATFVSALLLILGSAIAPIEWRLWIVLPIGTLTIWLGFCMLRRSIGRGS
jgi:hypothetical protein